tara:strand:+ start:1167 stop:1376 length:210 start_codon:yes stop_codon:yes gene_type:complete
MKVDEYNMDKSLSLYAGLLNKVLFIKAKTKRVADKETNKIIEDLQRTVEWMRDEHIAHNIEAIERRQGV